MVTLNIQGLNDKISQRIVTQYDSKKDIVYNKGDLLRFGVKVKNKEGDVIERRINVIAIVKSVCKVFDINHTDIYVELDIPSLLTIGDIISILDSQNDNNNIEL